MRESKRELEEGKGKKKNKIAIYLLIIFFTRFSHNKTFIAEIFPWRKQVLEKYGEKYAFA